MVKSNLKIALVPPLSGYVKNSYRDSCWEADIREKIWAKAKIRTAGSRED